MKQNQYNKKSQQNRIRCDFLYELIFDVELIQKGH